MRRTASTVVLAALLAGPVPATAETADPAPRAPSNDAFAASQTIDGDQGSVDGDNTDATTEPGEPDRPRTDEGPHRTVWYAWTARTDRRLEITAAGRRTLDLTLDVHVGEGVDTLTSVASDDASGPGSGSAVVRFDAVAGVEYHVRVGGFLESSTGPFELTWGAPSARSRVGLDVAARAVEGSRPVLTVSVTTGRRGSAVPARGLVDLEAFRGLRYLDLETLRLRRGVVRWRLPELPRGTIGVEAAYRGNASTRESSGSTVVVVRRHSS